MNEPAPKTVKGHHCGQVQASTKPHQLRSDLIGCSKMSVEDVWVVGVPKLTTESSIRLVDVNQDGELDVILGFGTGADGRNVPNIVCKIYFNGSTPCFGGVMALEGRTGKELWRHYTPHEVYGLNCNADLNKDGIADCLAGGRAGVFQAISGKDGSLIWNFGKQDAKNGIMNLYTAQLIRDLDGDGVLDILAIHGGDPLQPAGSPHRLSGRIIIFSGQTGKVLRWVGVPDKRESYYSPQVYLLPGGKEMVLFGTGGETHPGSLWRISLSDLYAGKIERAQRICGDSTKGVMTPPVLLDLTGDGVSDIILPLYNSTVLAIDGHSLAILWNHTFPESESYNTPAAGYYNNDDVPDFMVKYAHGPGFPIYYYSQTTILDGRTGKSLINPPIRDTVGAISSPLTVSMEGQGNDLFLYWIADCLQHEGQGVEYSFEKGTNVHKQSRADFCRLAFKTKGFAKLYATSQHIKTPGTVIYFSEERDKEEHKAWVNTTTEAIEFVSHHPEYLENYLYYNSLNTDSQKSRYDPVTRQRLINEFGPYNQETNNFYDELKGTPMSSEAKKGKFLHHRKTTPKLPPNYYNNYKNQGPGPGPGLGRSGGYSLNEAPTRMNNGRIDVNNRESAHNGDVDGINYDGTNSAQYDDIYDDGGGTGSYPSRDYSQNSQDYSLYPYSQNGQAPSGDRMMDARTNTDAEGDMRPGEMDESNLPKYNDPTNVRGQNRPYEYGRMRLKRFRNAPRLLYGNDKARVMNALAYGVDENINPAKFWLTDRSLNRKAETFKEHLAEEDEPMPKSFMRKKRSPARRWNMGKDSVKRKMSSKKRKTKTIVLTSSSNRARMAAGIYRHERKTKRTRRKKNRKREPRGNLPDFMKTRVKRHIGPHDTKGLMRLISTGTLAPSTLSANHPDRKYSIDLVFATYWFFPAETRFILPENKKCIEKKMAKQKIRFNRKSKYFGMDSDAYEKAVTEECLNTHQDQSKKIPHHHDNYNPFYIPMGQMTIYRLRLKCTCAESEDIKSGKKRCARTLPFEEQQWPSYMGSNGDSHWLPRPQSQQPTVVPGKKS